MIISNMETKESIMATVSYKGRSSMDYRFTVKSLDDPAIAQLKALLVERNGYIKGARKMYGLTSYYGKQKTQGLRIRPRGPRKNSWAYDTPAENATHYDVYIRDYN
jgi:hypothetical protein